MPSNWTKWVDRPGVRAKWAIYFQNPKGTKFTNKAQINKYIEKYHLSYSSDMFDFELDENVTKLQKIWKRFIFKKSSDLGALSDESSSNTDDVDNGVVAEKNKEEVVISSKKITPLYSEASWLNRINIPNTRNNMGMRKRQRSGSYLAVAEKKSSKSSKLDLSKFVDEDVR